MRELDHGRPGVVWTPRPDLSGDGKDVMEFRIRSHDGGRLRGLFARPTWQKEPWTARIRSAAPTEPATVDGALVRDGHAEFVLQESENRPLSDRVLDVVQVCRLALGTEGITQVEIQVPTEDEPRCADELMIAGQLLSNRIVAPLGRNSAVS